MPNSTRPFVLNWAPGRARRPPKHYRSPKEYGIFVGDLAPETSNTSNSDLVAVFRNPVLGLRNDREPKFIRSFQSCKSAKIMLDPVTGVSRVWVGRFTDEADQQRALIEMHHCMGCIALVDRGGYGNGNENGASVGNASFAPGNGNAPNAPTTAISVNPNPNLTPNAAEWTSPTSAEWKHHAHARAILGNLIGPNGEQLMSPDPGGLSLLVGEETLRTFFVPFGEIHYVKVPVGKHCGFVQFVRKADAERAIEKMQGFPVGRSRIRLSWGRIQSAQAAAASAEQAMMLLQKFGMQGHVDAAANASNTANGSGDPYAGPNGAQLMFTEKKVRSALLAASDDGPFSYAYTNANGRAPYEVPPPSTSSAFSPDPNQHRPRRDIGGSTGAGSTRTGTTTGRRRRSRLTGTSSSSSMRTTTRSNTSRGEFEVMHDLNGTLASLDLDRERELDRDRDRPWSLKSPIPESFSGGSVQFRMTMGRTPSP
ncbi:hypothetical protein C8J57DRAFT_1442248 [Mycena rebaudengoi]|nr:hypothetical protein C8J57DRAFT_1442248 [Mycena rebaudengoi]